MPYFLLPVKSRPDGVSGTVGVHCHENFFFLQTLYIKRMFLCYVISFGGKSQILELFTVLSEKITP